MDFLSLEVAAVKHDKFDFAGQTSFSEKFGYT